MDEVRTSAAPPPFRRERWMPLRALSWLAVGGAALALLFAHLWPPALTETSRDYVLISFAAFLILAFQLHAGLALLPVAAFAAAGKRRRLLLATAPLLALTLAPALWAYRPRAAPPVAPGADALTVLSVNLLYSRADADALAAEIAATDPDVILFQEYSSRDRKRLATLLDATYPHRSTVERDDAFGQAVYSRRAFLSPPRKYPSGVLWTEPQITASVDLGGKPVSITNVHLLPPVSLRMMTHHRLQAAALADDVRKRLAAGESVVLGGDFNATPGAPHLLAMERAGLRESHALAGRGRGTTWPRTGALAYAPGIRLDHIFISKDLVCLAAGTGLDTGSDHRPVTCRVARRPQPP